MALTPLQIGAKGTKRTDWDNVAQAMQIAGSAVGIANSVSNLAGSATPPPTTPPVESVDVAKYQVPDMTPQISKPPMDAYQRRLLGR